jgi:hypothetical protein
MSFSEISVSANEMFHVKHRCGGREKPRQRLLVMPGTRARHIPTTASAFHASSGDGERRASYRPGVMAKTDHDRDRVRAWHAEGVFSQSPTGRADGATRSPRLTTHFPNGEWVRPPMPPRRTVAGQPAGGREAPINTPERP